MALGLADQQLNGSNPRVYDFKSRAEPRSRRAPSPGDVIVFTPTYIDHVVALLRGRRPARCSRSTNGLPGRAAARACSCSPRFLDKPQYRDGRAGRRPQAVAPPRARAPRQVPADPDLGVPPMTTITDTRLRRPAWSAAAPDSRAAAGAIRAAARARWCRWRCSTSPGCSQPERVGNPALYGAADRGRAVQRRAGARVLVDVLRASARGAAPALATACRRPVDVFIPVYDEPVDVVEPTVRAATRDDRRRRARAPARRRRQRRHAAAWRRATAPATSAAREHDGRQGGQHQPRAAHTDAPYVVVLDCDHVPEREFLEATLGCFADERVAFVQTPQYYANADRGEIAGAPRGASRRCSSARSPAARTATTRCSAAAPTSSSGAPRSSDVGGFPTESVTEDFELSIALHERGWRSRYVPEVLAHGLGPEDMASYVSQQQRWSRGCLSAPAARAARSLPLRQKAAVPAVGVVLPPRLDRARLHEFPVVRHADRRAAAASAPRPTSSSPHFAPYFGAVAARGHRARRRRLHVQGVRAAGGELLDPRPVDV